MPRLRSVRVPRPPTVVNRVVHFECTQDQRNSFGPNVAPNKAGSNMPKEYQLATKGTVLSLQYKPYTTAAAAPDNKPVANPAQRSRVGAARRKTQHNIAN